MWIRSQDKTRLINISHIIVDETNILATTYYEGFFVTIGEYSSQEKALNVLDMIQECIEHNNSHQNARIGVSYLEYNVFQMPLDSEIEENDK